ncbi:hypothetical protein ZEAMMB73_Zm00001d021728, partial [Zea mays]
ARLPPRARSPRCRAVLPRPLPCKPHHDAATDPPSTCAPRAPTRNAGSHATGGGQPVAIAPGPHPACCSKRRPLPHALVPGPPPPCRRRQDAPLLRAAQRRPPGDAGRPRAPLPGHRARHPRPARARLSRPPPHATLTRWHHGQRPGYEIELFVQVHTPPPGDPLPDLESRCLDSPLGGFVEVEVGL